MNRWRHWIFRVNANCCLSATADTGNQHSDVVCQPFADEILHLADRVMVLENGQVKALARWRKCGAVA